ncbi:hypothetical protein EGT07_23675 [Herbaspirillum sp. HC18]|nr:hypothetical protein EGT07_23675 [Herbaspirillum sp. HC18]
MSNTGTRMIAPGSAQVVRLELVRNFPDQPLAGSATILYRQFEWSAPREFCLEIDSVETEKLLRESMYRRNEIRLDVYRPEGEFDLVEKWLAKARFFFGTIKSKDVAYMSLGLNFPPFGLPE